MQRLEDILRQSAEAGLYQIVVSGPRRKNGAEKIKIRPVMLQGGLC